MDHTTKQEVLARLKDIDRLPVSDTLNWPNAYCKDPSNIKAIVLGCDPSNTHDKELKYAFGIETETPLLKGFFAGILKNLAVIGMSLNDVYVQNLCQNYFEEETSKNKSWNKAAAVWIPYLKAELDQLPISKIVPVFLTAAPLYQVLTADGIKKIKPRELYTKPELLPVKVSDNYLERPLFPLYRGGRGAYQLDREEWSLYVKNIQSYFSHNS
ncbi:hypothetical protein [Daejeonella oryzae]|uniref:hypothetical protein n=1 Tax=Daejeonella oryzae TaxID=1122943 RepID=UPI0003FD9E71|nr:hypothetical protein [Daejeonella oryzae]